MAHVVLISQGLAGVLYPVLELGRRLELDGHRVTVVAPESVASLVEAHGASVHPPPESGLGAFVSEDRARPLGWRLRHVARRRLEAVARSRSLELADQVAGLAPDLVLVDGELLEALVALVGRGLRVAQLNSFASIWRRPCLPPTHRKVRPGVGLAGSRVGCSLLWTDLLVRKRWRALRQRVSRVGIDRVSLLRTLAGRVGVDASELDDRQWLRPVTLRSVPALSLHSLDWEFPHRPADHVRYVGPLVADSRPSGEVSEADRETLARVVAARRSGRPLVYAAFGSQFTTQGERLRGLVEALRPEWQLLIAGTSARDALPRDPPDGVHAVSWAPQLEVLETADVTVTHGGINTLDECLLAGVPVLVDCGWRTDMAGNTARVLYHGVGLERRRGDGPAALRAKLDRLLGEPGFREAARRLGDAYRRATVDRLAETAVGELLEGTWP